MKKIIIFAIDLYQKTLSPDHGWLKPMFPNGFCKYHPSCSQFTKQAVQKYGLFGLVMGFFRILRCNPFSRGGMDVVK